MVIERILSGGQAGADRGGLDGALQFWGNAERIGGWCPSGRRAEDGPIPAKYPLEETAEWDYPLRTRLNILAADGTVIFTDGSPSGGSRFTVSLCEELTKPHLCIDLMFATLPEAIDTLVDWIDSYGIKVLNVAGSRESSCEGIQHWVTAVIHDTLLEIGVPAE